MHVPKSAGTSVYAALRAALPGVTLSQKSNDASTFCYGFTAFETLGREARDSLLVEDSEFDDLLSSEIVFGHFSLPTLLRIAPPESIATVLREPRSRLISFYAWQRLTPGVFDIWSSYRPEVEALRPLDEYLSEPQIAPEVDNVVCRMLLYGDPRIPALDFICPDDIEGLASDAINRLDQFGFVGVVEHGLTTWEGLSRFFQTTLVPARERVTASMDAVSGALPLRNAISDRALDLLEARSAVDAIIYDHVLMAKSTEAEASKIRNSAFAAQLVQLGDVAGGSAASAQSLVGQLAESESRRAGLEQELIECQAQLAANKELTGRLEAQLADHRTWLAGIQNSTSWRLTRPLRAAKRRALGSQRR